MNRKIIQDIESYYTGKVRQFGPRPQGVDWRDGESQQRRFVQLLKLLDGKDFFELNDLGCGYGGLLEFLNGLYPAFCYRGYDLSQAMIKEAEKKFPGRENYSFHLSSPGEDPAPADYTVASGIFNVKMEYCEEEWLEYILSTLQMMRRCSRRGLAFNILTSYSDPEYMRKDLYYADPCFWFDYCKRNFSRNVALLHDYNLYEFTILVRL